MNKKFIIVCLLISAFFIFGIKNAESQYESVTREAALAILQKYQPTNQGIQQALPELQQAFGPQVKILEHPVRLDKIDFGGGLVVDVIGGAGGPNPSWGWIVEGEEPPPLPPAQNLGDLVEDIFGWALALVGIAVFVNFLWAGVLWFSAAGRPGPITQAKEKMFNALIGFIILLAAYLILNTINPDLVKQTFTLPGLK